MPDTLFSCKGQVPPITSKLLSGETCHRISIKSRGTASDIQAAVMLHEAACAEGSPHYCTAPIAVQFSSVSFSSCSSS